MTYITQTCTYIHTEIKDKNSSTGISHALVNAVFGVNKPFSARYFFCSLNNGVYIVDHAKRDGNQKWTH
jgi:hypothetical protein